MSGDEPNPVYTPERLNRVLLRVLVAMGVDGLLMGVSVLYSHLSGSWFVGWGFLDSPGFILSMVFGIGLSCFLVLVVVARILVGIAYRR